MQNKVFSLLYKYSCLNQRYCIFFLKDTIYSIIIISNIYIKLKKLFLLLFFFQIENLLAAELKTIRFGEKNSHLRIVIDLSEKINYKFQKDPNTLRFEFKKNFSEVNLKLKQNKYVEIITYDKVTRIINIKFRKKVNILKVFSINKNDQNPNFRIVIDFLFSTDFKPKVVVIDPGHGGRDSGAVGKFKILEKNVTLAVAKKLKKRCDKSLYLKCFLTRNNDTYISLRNRIKFARRKKADLFISLHADYNTKSRVRGISFYTLSEKASDKEAAALARRENQSDLIVGLDLSDESKEVRNILIDLTQRDTMNQSSVFVNTLIDELKRNFNLLQRTHRFAGFAVLKAPDIPSVLIEMGYLSNAKDAKLLVKDEYQKKIVNGIFNATMNYLIND